MGTCIKQGAVSIMPVPPPVHLYCLCTASTTPGPPDIFSESKQEADATWARGLHMLLC